jgi:hypothetical protein
LRGEPLGIAEQVHTRALQAHDRMIGRPRAILVLRTPAEAFAGLLLDGLSEDTEDSLASTG